jgi:formylglycine-generating enzyme required for sulfatase activity
MTTMDLAASLVVGMSVVAGGEYRPLYYKQNSELITVSEFLLDITPVTNRQFFEFVQDKTAWQKNRIPKLFTEDTYLQHWQTTGNIIKPDESENQAAVVNVSWFAAQAYCKDQGKRLPTVAEWEFVARASESAPDGSTEQQYNERILGWYAKPNSNTTVGQTPGNFWNVKDLHGLIWEWTEDFNSNLITGESRADASVDNNLYCAAGAVGAADPRDYAAFMRYGFRSSLQARYAISNLGFRCARSASSTREKGNG